MAFALTFTNDGTNATVAGFSGSPVPSTLTIPDNDGLGHPVTAIGINVFNLQVGITSVTFPATLTSIGNNAFADTGLEALTFPVGSSLTSIGEYAFDYCSGITGALTFPAGLTSIGTGAFRSCGGLTSITFPASLTGIASSAFYGCTGLEALTFPVGSSLTSIGNGAFRDCTSLTTLTFPGSLTIIGGQAFLDCTDLATLAFLGYIPSFGTSVLIGTSVSTSGAPSITAPANQGWSDPLIIDNTGGGSTSYPVLLVESGNICFPAATPVETDQGVVAISEINPDIHTIRGQTVLAVTRTVMEINNRLVVFEEDALGENYPSQKTTCSPNHKILYNGKMVEAYLIANSFNGKNPAVYRVDYDNQPLYNVVLPEHSTMVVNNMTVETLAPHNPIAKRFMKLFVAAAEERISLLLDDTPTAICA